MSIKNIMETEIMYTDSLGMTYDPTNLSLSIGENFIASVGEGLNVFRINLIMIKGEQLLIVRA